MRRPTAIGALVGAIGTAIVAFVWYVPGPPPATVTPAHVRGGTLSTSMRSEPLTFNRYAAVDSASILVTGLLGAGLVRVNRVTDAIEPWLAEGWTVSEDGLEYTLKLRKNVRFSDGTPFTSSDVLFSFAALNDPKAAFPLADTVLVAGKPISVTAPGPDTVVLRFPGPYGPGLRLLDNVPMLPRQRLQAALDEGRMGEVWGPSTPPSELVGLGPFVVAVHRPGERLELARNPHYWHRDAAGVQLPYLDRLLLEIVPEQNAEVLRLESGASDFLPTEVRPEDYAALKRLADERRLKLVDLGIGLDTNFLWFNLRPDSAIARSPRRWLLRVELRRAISHAIDRAAFANSVLLGVGVPIYGPVTSAYGDWYSPELPKYPYDVSTARELLKAIGLRDADGDGMLEDPDGAPATFSLLTQRGNTGRERAAVVLKNELAKVGLGVDVVLLDFGAVVGRVMSGDYEAAYLGFAATDTDPSESLEFWLSSGGFHAWNPLQKTPATEWERRIDELMMRQVAALDRAERHRLFVEAQRVFADQIPAIFFVAPRIHLALGNRVANATPSVRGPYILWNAETLAVAQSAPAQ